MLNKFEEINLGLLPSPPFKKRWIIEHIFPVYTDLDSKYLELQEHLRLHTDKKLIATYLRLIIRTGAILQKFKSKIQDNEIVDFRELSKIIDMAYILRVSMFNCKTVPDLNTLIENNDLEGLAIVYTILDELLVYIQTVFEILAAHNTAEKVFEKVDVI